MTGSLDERAFRIFDEACDLEGDARRRLLDARCAGNAALRRMIERMLELNTAADPLDAGEGAEIIASRIIGDDSIGRPERIGQYRIIRELGRGGMGIVYEAQQDEPHRRVALKVMREGFASTETRRRFRQEAELLAQLQHRGIAHVYQTGTAPVGHASVPYIAMEFVEGEPLDRHADALSLNVRERLELVARVCDAVQHAHQKGILHRDLKMANLLVATDQGAANTTDSDSSAIDAIGQPKVLDFGVGRLTGNEPGATLHRTQTGQMIGTLAYMSPEQVSGDPEAIDTRTDVYSLGVILYRLLVGRMPHDLDSTGLGEATRLIRDVEPVRLRSIDPHLRGDIDTIAAKALEKDPDRRYQTAAALAEDIRRHLHNQPILARSASPWYQFRKFTRRNRILVGGVVATALAILAGGALSAYFAVSEHRQRERADEQRRLADERYQQVVRLSDMKRLNDAIAAADSLWPELPRTIPAMKAWFKDDAEPLAANLDLHRATLEKLRSQGKPVKNESDEITGWRFPDPDLQWRYDTLAKLVVRLDHFAHARDGAMDQVRKRMENAQLVGQYTLESDTAAAAWRRAAAVIESMPVYKGIALKPQAGLLPLGPDPTSGLYDFLHLRSGNPPQRSPDTGRLIIAPETGIVVVLLPGGRFRMGAQSSDPSKPNFDPDALADESPVRAVTLQPFFVSKYEVTQSQWRRLTGEVTSGYSKLSSEVVGQEISEIHPLEQVTWKEAVKFLRHYDFELPTEAQWEYAARGGTATPWWTGSDVSSLVGAADLADLTLEKARPETFRTERSLDDGYIVHAPVGSFAPNPFGLYDVIGNVGEWCRDSKAPYSNAASGPDALRESAGNERYIVRGGSWKDLPVHARSAARYDLPYDARSPTVGFRPVLRLKD